MTELSSHAVHIHVFDSFCHVRKLCPIFRALDLGQGQDVVVKYNEPETNLRHLVANLPHLIRLDLSGTNLAGFVKPKESDAKDGEATTDE